MARCIRGCSEGCSEGCSGGCSAGRSVGLGTVAGWTRPLLATHCVVPLPGGEAGRPLGDGEAAVPAAGAGAALVALQLGQRLHCASVHAHGDTEPLVKGCQMDATVNSGESSQQGTSLAAAGDGRGFDESLIRLTVAALVIERARTHTHCQLVHCGVDTGLKPAHHTPWCWRTKSH